MCPPQPVEWAAGTGPTAPGRQRTERAEPSHPNRPAGRSCRPEPSSPGQAQPREQEPERGAWPGPWQPTRADMRLRKRLLRQDPNLRQELASLARGCDFVLPSRFKKRLKAFQQVQVQTKKEEPLPPASSQSIPTFYFPQGRPQGTVNVDAVIAKIERTFPQFPHERATMEDMGKVAKVQGILQLVGDNICSDHPLEGDVHRLWRPFVHLKTPSQAPKVSIFSCVF
ncbi:serine/threonine-protein phosphatase 2A regulatory subunit B'' subunit beta-like [Equus asinus]|uniref:serine/threonine-protein phosphatase 2A regulatory subunit B'' subunit beta-like n=1 Tax=Equus asinus TaxID=9793 RepID=UPI0038F78ED1